MEMCFSIGSQHQKVLAPTKTRLECRMNKCNPHFIYDLFFRTQITLARSDARTWTAAPSPFVANDVYTNHNLTT